ncbi:MAG: dTDP-glucose 4,6-dehydratase [Elusimicrobiales bacterium]
MKIAVTGGLGFIGSNFVRHVLDKHTDWHVLNIDKKTYAGNPDNLRDVSGNPRYKWLRADIADLKKMRAALEGIDAVVHFAAESHVDRSILHPGDFIRTNVVGTHCLLEAARACNIKRFVHVSTDEVYGSVEEGRSVETDPLLPNSAYSASKASSDLLVRAYFVTYKLPVVTTRCTNNYGPYQYPEKALPLLITNAGADKPFPLYGDGKNVREWIYVQDHVEAVEAVLLKGREGEVYNIGGGKLLSNVEIVKTVLDLMGKPHTLIQPVADRPGHDRRYALDCEKIARETGWRHRFKFEDAIKLTIDWYAQNRKWWLKLKTRAKYRSYYKKQYAGKAK